MNVIEHRYVVVVQILEVFKHKLGSMRESEENKNKVRNVHYMPGELRVR